MGDPAPLALATTNNVSAFSVQVRDAAPSEPLAAYEYFEAALVQLEQFNQEPDFLNEQCLLLGHFYLNGGAYKMTTADFEGAAQLLQQASVLFLQVDATNWATACKGIQLAAQACVEMKQQNMGAGKKLIADAQKLLAADPVQSLKFAPLIDSTTCTSLGLGAFQAVQMLDFSKAQVMFEEASTSAEAYARKYLEAGSPAHFQFLGLGKFWRAQFQFSMALADLQSFSFERLIEQGDIARTAREAQALLAQGVNSPLTAGTYSLCGAVVGMLEVLPSIASLANALMQGQPAPKIDYDTLQAHLRAAQNAAAAGGEGLLVIYRICERVGSTVENLRQFDRDRQQPIARPSDPNTPIHLFVIMPFAEQSKLVEQALRIVLEDEPYWFKITLARDATLTPNLLDNVKAHMYLADAFLADISGLNPNVMMELGMVESDPAQRPVFILKRKAKKGEKEVGVPSDLKGRLYIEYKLGGTQGPETTRLLADELRTNLSNLRELTGLMRRPHTRYLSSQYVQRKLKDIGLSLDADKIAALQKGFPSLEDLESATPEQISLKTGLNLGIAQNLTSRPADQGRIGA